MAKKQADEYRVGGVFLCYPPPYHLDALGSDDMEQVISFFVTHQIKPEKTLVVGGREPNKPTQQDLTGPYLIGEQAPGSVHSHRWCDGLQTEGCAPEFKCVVNCSQVQPMEIVPVCVCVCVRREFVHMALWFRCDQYLYIRLLC